MGQDVTAVPIVCFISVRAALFVDLLGTRPESKAT